MEPENLVGKTIGGYEIQRELGRGGMGVVYEAREESLNRIVALKVLAVKFSANPDFIRRFRREAQAAAALVHPNIVPIYAIGETEGIHYFSMEYVRGASLAEHLRDHAPLPPGETLDILAQVVSALEAAHEAGVVHRDIKPQNIMVDPAGRVRVMDFGLAKVVADASSNLTIAGQFLGTLRYASPEQCEGHILDGRSDLYSLGVVLFECLTGKSPYKAESTAALVRELLLEPPPPLRSVRPELSPELDYLTRRLLAKSPADRFGGAAELLAHLTSLQGRELIVEPSAVDRAAPSGEKADLSAAASKPAQQAPPLPQIAPDVSKLLLPARAPVCGPGATDEPLPRPKPVPVLRDQLPFKMKTADLPAGPNPPKVLWAALPFLFAAAGALSLVSRTLLFVLLIIGLAAGVRLANRRRNRLYAAWSAALVFGSLFAMPVAEKVRRSLPEEAFPPPLPASPLVAVTPQPTPAGPVNLTGSWAGGRYKWLRFDMTGNAVTGRFVDAGGQSGTLHGNAVVDVDGTMRIEWQWSAGPTGGIGQTVVEPGGTKAVFNRWSETERSDQEEPGESFVITPAPQRCAVSFAYAGADARPQITIDDVLCGFTPLVVAPLSPGRHFVTVSARGNTSRSIVLDLAAGKWLEYEIPKMEPSAARSGTAGPRTPAPTPDRPPANVSPFVGVWKPGIGEKRSLGTLTIEPISAGDIMSMGYDLQGTWSDTGYRYRCFLKIERTDYAEGIWDSTPARPGTVRKTAFQLETLDSTFIPDEENLQRAAATRQATLLVYGLDAKPTASRTPPPTRLTFER